MHFELKETLHEWGKEYTWCLPQTQKCLPCSWSLCSHQSRVHWLDNCVANIGWWYIYHYSFLCQEWCIQTASWHMYFTTFHVKPTMHINLPLIGHVVPFLPCWNVLPNSWICSSGLIVSLVFLTKVDIGIPDEYVLNCVNKFWWSLEKSMCIKWFSICTNLYRWLILINCHIIEHGAIIIGMVLEHYGGHPRMTN